MPNPLTTISAKLKRKKKCVCSNDQACKCAKVDASNIFSKVQIINNTLICSGINTSVVVTNDITMPTVLMGEIQGDVLDFPQQWYDKGSFCAMAILTGDTKLLTHFPLDKFHLGGYGARLYLLNNTDTDKNVEIISKYGQNIYLKNKIITVKPWCMSMLHFHCFWFPLGTSWNNAVVVEEAILDAADIKR